MSGDPISDTIIVRQSANPWQGELEFKGKRYRCALGKAGLTTHKREGDHKTPVGCFALRELLFRPDRPEKTPQTGLTARALNPGDGWCDDPADPAYNRPVALPYPASTENLWREDNVYDLIVPLGYNDNPPIPGLGSAIFMHIARPDLSGTEGCVALAHEDLTELLAHVQKTTMMEIRAFSG